MRPLPRSIRHRRDEPFPAYSTPSTPANTRSTSHREEVRERLRDSAASGTRQTTHFGRRSHRLGPWSDRMRAHDPHSRHDRLGASLPCENQAVYEPQPKTRRNRFARTHCETRTVSPQILGPQPAPQPARFPLRLHGIVVRRPLERVDRSRVRVAFDLLASFALGPTRRYYTLERSEPSRHRLQRRPLRRYPSRLGPHDSSTDMVSLVLHLIGSGLAIGNILPKSISRRSMVHAPAAHDNSIGLLIVQVHVRQVERPMTRQAIPFSHVHACRFRETSASSITWQSRVANPLRARRDGDLVAA